MTKRFVVLLSVVLLIATVGCGGSKVINIDGMPVSNHEYNLTNDETKIRTVFVLASYSRVYEGDEYIVKPRYLDALHPNRIESDEVDQLVLHIKVINLKGEFYSMLWEIIGPQQQLNGSLYNGRLSRKDFFITLPLTAAGDYQYSFRINDATGDDMFTIPPMRYKLKGGAAEEAQNYGLN